MSIAAVGRREQAVWSLFADWCAALDHQALPANPTALAEFLGAHPAAGPTQRRRVAVINAVHRRAGHPRPGHAPTIRTLLDEHRAAGGHRRIEASVTAIASMPQQGWPTALFAHRDSMLLVLAAAGIPARRIPALRVGQLEADPHTDALTITASERVFRTPEELPRLGVSPRDVWQKWFRVRGIQHHLSSTRWLAAHLRGEPVPKIADAPGDLPLVTPIDRWGATPLLPTPLSVNSTVRIIGEHLHGAAKPHRSVAVTIDLDEDDNDDGEIFEEPHPLDPNSFTRGLEARRRAARELDGVTAVLDDIDSRADALLANLLQLLEDPDS